jgi:hypothetical protein
LRNCPCAVRKYRDERKAGLRRERVHERAEQGGRELAGEQQRLAGEPWREVVERVSRNEHDGGHLAHAISN